MLSDVVAALSGNLNRVNVPCLSFPGESPKTGSAGSPAGQRPGPAAALTEAAGWHWPLHHRGRNTGRRLAAAGVMISDSRLGQSRMHGGPLGAGPEARPRPTSHRHMTVVLRRAESDGRDRVMPCYRDDRFGLVTRQ